MRSRSSWITQESGDRSSPASRPPAEHFPALDGLRAFAVLGVMAFHSGVSGLPGGFLGVDLFFVLSGYLITDLLVREFLKRRTIGLIAFWGRRARRLLPAVVVMLLGVAAWVAIVTPPGSYPSLRGDSLASLFYFANWHYIYSGQSYFALTALASPLTHTWSLAIEEQFYLLWPLVVLAVLRYTRSLRLLLLVSGLGALGSAVEMALRYQDSSLNRLYYGTDTHAQCILVGASLAIVLIALARREGVERIRVEGRRATAMQLTGVCGAGLTAFLWVEASGSDQSLYQGGFLLAAIAAAALVLSTVTAPGSLLARVLSLGPLRYLGRISYGMYLWHFPLFLLVLTGARTALSGLPLFGLRTAATIAVATISYFVVEQPIRQRRFLGAGWSARLGLPVGIAASVTGLVLLTGGQAVATVDASRAGGAGHGPQAMAGPTGGHGPTTRVLILGDSVSATLAQNLGVTARHYGATVDVGSQFGCGLVNAQSFVADGRVYIAPPLCNSSTPPIYRLPTYWSEEVARYRPQVVVVLSGRWERTNADVDGHTVNILDPAYAARVKAGLTTAVTIAGSHGARVVLMTTPCTSSGEQPNGDPWPEDSTQRLAAYNHLVAAVATRQRVQLVNLDSLVCPGGRFTESLDGVEIRSPDGVHMTDQFSYLNAAGEWLGPRLWPSILGTPPTPAGLIRVRHLRAKP